MRTARALQLALLLLVPTTDSLAQQPPSTTGFHGFLFGDVVYVARESPFTDGFFIGQVVGHGNVRMSERTSFFGELSATAHDANYTIEVERAILRYDFVDAFKLSVGRYHTPVSYWNTAYHHGLWLQTSVARPEMIKVGGTFIPVHFVGAMAEGRINTGALGISYEVGVGNGRGANIARGGDAGDVNRSRATLLALRFRPYDTGLQIGGAVYFDRITGDTLFGSFDERISSAHIVWDRGAPELIAEYAQVHHDPALTGDALDSDAWYVQAGWRLGGALNRFKPYGRIERVDINGDDPIFASAMRYRGIIGGLRFDFDTFAALKGEYRRERFGMNDWSNGFYLQAAFAIATMGGI